MLQEGSLRQDFRFRGFPNQNMHSPRQPITAPIAEDKKRNEENFVKVFGKSSIFDPAHHQYWKPSEDRRTVAPETNMASLSDNWTAAPAKPRVDEGHRGLQYGTEQIDNSPRARGMKDPFNEKSSAEVRKLRQLQSEAQEDIRKFKQEKLMQDFHREEEKKRENDLQAKYYPWDRLNRGHGAPKADNDNRRRKFLENDASPRDTITYTKEPQKPPTYSKVNKTSNNRTSALQLRTNFTIESVLELHRGHDLFIDTLGGPGGTVVRQNGGPGLQSMPDPRMGAYRSPGLGGQERDAELSMQETRIREQKQKIEDLKKELDFLKSPRGQEAYRTSQGGGNQDRYQPFNTGYEPSFGGKDSIPPRAQINGNFDQPRREEKRSLDLEATRGGAGAPVRDDHGKAITRFPVTMERDDYGGAKIQERIPGKRYILPDDPVYDPFGRPGGGAPMMDRYGNRNTHTFGNFEKKGDSAEHTKRVRAKEVMLNDLRIGMEEQKRNKEEMKLQEKAPYGELAEVIRLGEVGQPKRDPITGTLANQHLPNSDVSKLKTGKENQTSNNRLNSGDTNMKTNYQPKDELEKRNLHNFLKEQVEENERNKHLDRLRNIQESNKHFDQFDQQWGAFGGGAPKDRVVRKKVNLDNALYHLDRQSRSEDTYRYQKPQFAGMQAEAKAVHPSYQKRYFEEDIRHRSPDVTPRYVKNTTHSTSGNLYEYPTDKSPRPVQKATPPYATGSAHAY